MTTATTLITDAMHDLGVLGAGKSPTANDLTDGLRRLNQMLMSWSLSTLLVPFRSQFNFTMTGQPMYTVGPGGEINIARPVSVESAFVRRGGIDYPVDVYHDRTFYDRVNKKTIVGIPRLVYYEATLPLGQLFVWYVGDASWQMFINIRGTLASFPDTDTDVEIPPGYEVAIHSNLALMIAPMYETTASQELALMARDTKTELKRLNRQLPIAQYDTAMPNHRRWYNIEVM